MSEESRVRGERPHTNGHRGTAANGATFPDAVPRSAEVQRQAEQVAMRREDLSQTVAALADKFDVRARSREAVGDLRTAAGRQLQPDRLLGLVAVAGAVAAAISVIAYVRRRPS